MNMEDGKRSRDLLGCAGTPILPAPRGPVVLLILDGVGVGAGDEFDAVALARTPNLDLLRRTGLAAASLRAHGTSVGLPSDADIGNSEVGHNIMGAGRVFDQGAKCVDRAIGTGTVWDGYWKTLVRQCRVRRRRLAPHGPALRRQRAFPRGPPARADPAAPTTGGAGAGSTCTPCWTGATFPTAPRLVYLERLEAVLGEHPRTKAAATTVSPPAAAGWW